MTGFCGWIGGTLPAPEGGPAIARMAEALPAPVAPETPRLATPGFGLAIGTDPALPDGEWFADDRFCAAIDGHSRWTDDALAAVAREAGHAAALARAYADRGQGLLDILKGDFSFAVLDRKANRGLVAIDRFGIRPMCYGSAPDGAVVFGSAADSVRAYPGFGATLNAQSIYDYLYFVDRVPAPDTVYREQRKLVPGECLVIEDGRAEARLYWRMPYDERREAPEAELAEELLHLLRQAVMRNVDGEAAAKVGAFLSGGLDSSTMVALLSEVLPDRVRSFTIGFEDQRFDESAYASLVAERFATEHHSFTLEPQHVIDLVARVSTAYDEPFANSSNIPALVCARQAKEAGVDMMIAGDGGDEYFAGNMRYLADGVFEHYQRVPAALRRFLLEPAIAAMPMRDRIPLTRKAAKYIQLAKMSPAQRLMRHNLFESVDPRQVFADDFLDGVDLEAPIRLVDGIFNATPSSSALHGMLYVDQRITLADSDLRKVSRMCHMAGVRVRYPFLDEDLVEFSARIPPDLLMRGNRIRAFYKLALKDVLPEATLRKEKHGFGLPYTQFVTLFGPLREIACDSLRTLRRRGYFKAAFLDDLVADIEAGSTSPIGGVAWDLMVLEQWLASRIGPA